MRRPCARAQKGEKREDASPRSPQYDRMTVLGALMSSFGYLTNKSDVLVREAALLEMQGDDASRENAHLLWKEALRFRALPTRQELTSHYYLGSYYFGKKSIAEGIKHYEKVLQVDPLLAFLKVGEANREPLIADFYLTLSTAYRSRARSVIKEQKDILAAMRYLERKVNNLGHMAAPSLLCELGLYYGRCGWFEKEKAMMSCALEAPAYGSESQEIARKKAAKFFEREAAAAEAPAQPLILGFGGEGRKPAWRKVVLGAAAGMAAAFALYMVLMPGPAEDLYSGAQRERNDHYEQETRPAADGPSPLAEMARGPSADVEWLGEQVKDETPPAVPRAAVPDESEVFATASTAATATTIALAPATPAVPAIESPPVPAKDYRAEIRSQLEQALRLLELRNGEPAPPVSVTDPQSRQRADQTWHQATLRSLDAALASLDTAMALASQGSAQETEALIAKWKLRIAHARSRVSTLDSFSNESSFLIQRAVAREIRDFID